jgi:hypothetical protein
MVLRRRGRFHPGDKAISHQILDSKYNAGFCLYGHRARLHSSNKSKPNGRLLTNLETN